MDEPIKPGAALVALRWAKTTAAQRKAFMKKLTKARLEKEKRAKAADRSVA